MKKSNCCGDIIDDEGFCCRCLEHCQGVTDWHDVIREERERQVDKGYTPEHDDKHSDGYLSSYAQIHIYKQKSDALPLDYKKRALVIAGALLVAELERLERVDMKEKSDDRDTE